MKNQTMMTPAERVLAIDNIETIESVYSGKNGKCCCGCNGKHYHRVDQKDYRGGGTKNDLWQIRRVLAVLKGVASATPDKIEAGGDVFKYFTTVIGERLYVVYMAE